MIGRKLGLTLRNWVIWHYTFGQCTKAKFARSHAHLFYFVKHPTEFTFRDLAVRTFSDRQRIYRDKRANPAGKIPDDTWNEFPRLCGTFGEREGWHPCQMPTSILGRIISSTSNVGDVVFDPFSGSGTTLAAAKKLSRKYLGTELSENYVKNIRLRLEKVTPIAEVDPESSWPDEHIEMLQNFYLEAAVPISTLGDKEHLLTCFTQHFNNRLIECGDSRSYNSRELHQQLSSLSSKTQLPMIKIHEKASRNNSKQAQSLFVVD